MATISLYAGKLNLMPESMQSSNAMNLIEMT